MVPGISNSNKWLILLSVIQLSGGHCINQIHRGLSALPRSTHLSVLSHANQCGESVRMVNHERGVLVMVLVRRVLSALPILHLSVLSIRTQKVRISESVRMVKGVPVRVLVRIPGPQCRLLFKSP